jgi:hypothetical protein
VTGDVVVRRHHDGSVEVLEAPQESLVSLGFLHQRDDGVTSVDGDRLTLAGQVVYQVTGWEPASAALRVRLVEDLRR